MPRAKKPKQDEPQVYVARSSGVVRIDGELHHYYAGTTRVRAGHPLLTAARGKFAPMQLDYETEDATNPPGRKRGE